MTAVTDLAPDEFVVDNPTLRSFIEAVSQIRHERDDPNEIIDGIRPHFAELLADQTWLPQEYQEPAEGSGMGSGIGTWLLFRAGDGSLALSALVVPPGRRLPSTITWPGAWWVCIAALQDEEVFTRTDDGTMGNGCPSTIKESRALTPR